MEVEVTQENLSKALSDVGRVANAKAGLPILGNILLRTDGKQLLVAATNLEIASVQKIGAKVVSNGSVTAPARLISEFVSNLPKGTVTIAVKKNILHITSEKHSSTINGASDEEFPELPAIQEKAAVTYSLNTDDFKTAATQTVITASNDSTRPVLTGVYWHTFNKHLYFAATDGYRLAEKKLMKAESDVSAIIPTSTIQEVLRLLGDENDQLEVLFDDTQVKFRLGEKEIISRLIDGNFPDYRQLIPSNNATSCTVAASELRRIVKLSGLFARETGGSILLDVNTDKNSLTIHSIASELGENTSELQVESKGDTGSITLNSRYLNEALSVISADEVTLDFSGKLSPCLITPVEKAKDYQHIIMPIKS